MTYLHQWCCKTCGDPQQTIDRPEYEYCNRHDLFTHLPCAACGVRTSITPADLHQTGRVIAACGTCVLIDNESGDSYADVQSLRSRANRPAGRELAGEGGSRAQREADDRTGPVADSRLDEYPADGDSGPRGLERRESREALGDLPGAEVALSVRGRKVAVSDRVEIVDGDGRGKLGEVIEIRTTLFGHVHVTLLADDGTRPTTLEDKVARV